MPYAYRKSERLRKNRDFSAVMQQGKRSSVDGLSLFYAKNGTENFRIGIAVSGKLANAVNRNRLRRRIRASAAKAIGIAARGYDLVFVARQGLIDAESGRILKAVETVLARTVLGSSGT